MTTNKKALVTGASEGIGRALAVRLAQEGYDVTAVARNEANLEELIAGLGSPHRYLIADLTTQAGVDTVRRALAAEHQDLLVNNAGIMFLGAFEQLPMEKHERVMRLNCDAMVSLAYAYLSTARPGDALMNVSSTLGVLGYPYASVYAASKAFGLIFSESLWYEQKDRGVFVTALCPGVTVTHAFEAAGGTNENRPPASISQTPEEVVDAAMAGLHARSAPSIFTSFTNKAMVFGSTRFMSRKAAVSMMGKSSPVHAAK